MGIVISLDKGEASKAANLEDNFIQLCEGTISREGHLIYIPLGGKVVDILKVFVKNNIRYELKQETEIAMTNVE